MTTAECPVAVFDSGVGGISVLKELAALLPHENFRYFGDSANAPYGTRSEDEVRHLTDRCVGRMIAEGAKAVVIACNTATSAAAETLRKKYTAVPIIGIEPALKPAVLEKKGSTILVMATPMTLRLVKFQRLMEKYRQEAEIIPMPCPGLMERVEAGETDTPETERFLRKLLAEYRERHIDAVVLGCTHYPFVRPLIQKIMGEQVRIFDGAGGTARELKRRLLEAGICNPQKTKGNVTFENSRPQETALCEKLFRD